MKPTTQQLIEKFQTAQPSHYAEIRSTFAELGFSGFHSFLVWVKEKLKSYDESDLQEIQQLLAKLREMFPDPSIYSPSWDRIWNRLERIFEYKNEIMNSIPPHDRDGEWQILLDNPYSHEGAVCSPGLSFIDAAYFYANQRVDLERNEFLRLQKIQTAFMRYGGD